MILTLPQFWCNLAVGWRNLHESREPLCDCFAWSFAVCGDFFEVAVWSFGIRSFRQHTLPSPSSVQRPTPHVLRAAASPAVVSRQVCKRRFPSRTGSFASSGVENQGCLSLRPRHGQLGHRLHAQIPPLHPPLVLLLLQDGADQP